MESARALQKINIMLHGSLVYSRRQFKPLCSICYFWGSVKSNLKYNMITKRARKNLRTDHDEAGKLSSMDTKFVIPL